MKIAVRLFVSSMLFALAIAGAYLWSTRDIVGVVLLSMMAIAMIVVAGYIIVAEKEAHLASDAPGATPSDVAGESLGVFSVESYWPVIGAAATALMLVGVVFLPGPFAIVALAAAAALMFSLRFLIRESA